MATKTLNNFGLPVATKQIRVAVRFDKWLDIEAKIIEKMISEWEHVQNNQYELMNSMNEPGIYPEVRLFTNKCVNEISLVLDEMWKEIQEAQTRHMKNVRRAQQIVKAIKD